MPVTNNPIQDNSSLSAEETSTTPSSQDKVTYTAESTPAKVFTVLVKRKWLIQAKF